MNGEQLEFFDDLPRDEVPEWKPESICAKCEHILSVRFQDRNLFFCTIQKGGKYGRKIKKNNLSCREFASAKNENIPQWDGYYGGYSESGVVRGV